MTHAGEVVDGEGTDRSNRTSGDRNAGDGEGGVNARSRSGASAKACERLGSMIELAQHYRGWTQREAAAALGRHVHAIIPDSGNPKLDIVVSLSEILDWPVEMVVADLRGKMDAPGGPGLATSPTSPTEARAIIHHAWQLMESERWQDLIQHSNPDLRRGIESETFARGTPRESPLQILFGFSLYVRGLVLRLRADVAGGDANAMLRDARRNLLESLEVLADHEVHSGSPRDSAIAQTARFAAGEIDVLLGERSTEAFIGEVLGLLDGAIDLSAWDSWEAESLGWCCVFASRVLMRDASAPAGHDRSLAILTSKLDEVADRLGHWSLRQHLFRIEHVHRVRSAGAEGEVPAWNFDEDDIRTLMGTMGRFPEFRPIGWQILKAVQAERKERPA